MTKKKAIIIAVVAVVITNIITIFSVCIGMKILQIGTNIDTSGASLGIIQKYNNVKYLIKSKYVGEIDDDKLLEGSIRGLAQAVEDPYTEYFDKQEYENMKIYTSANYAGIGVVISVDSNDNLLLVSEVYKASPAEKANIHAGDKIVKVNGKSVDGDSFDEAVQMIRGLKGSKVNMTVYRQETNETIDLSVERDEIEIETVNGRILDSKIGYIRILQFGEKTSQEFRETLTQLEKQGMEKLIIDLRDNPGGLLDQVVDITGEIVSKELIVYTVDKDNSRVDYYPEGNPKGLEYPIVVLINERSASASEIFAGVIKDYEKGVLIGKKTFGKGVVQSLYPLLDGSGIKITTSKYYTPSGISIHKVGVEPNIEVGLEKENLTISKLTFEEDLQLQKAIEVLNAR